MTLDDGVRRIDRLTPDDVVALVTDVGPVPMHVGAIVVLDGSVERSELADRLAERLPAVPRLRQRLDPTPWFGGRAVWVDDDHFDLSNHVVIAPQRAAGQRAAGHRAAGHRTVLDIAAESICRPLDRAHPLWRITLVSLDDGRSALVAAFHHAVADGIGGLAVLANLIDEAGAPPPDEAFPRPRPSHTDLVRDAARSRLDTIAHPTRSLRRVADALVQLRPSRGGAPQRTSFNVPTGPERRLLAVEVPLGPLHAAARRRGATINDALLTAVGGAVGALLDERGDAVDELVISMPMSARTETGGTSLGNQVGAVPVRVPLHGGLVERLEGVARRTEQARSTVRGSSNAILGPVFRVLARTGLFRWFVDHQRLVHTFVTNLRGPQQPMALLGHTVTEVHPVATIAGNVTASFAALSYAGTLGVTIIVDPVAVPDADALRARLQQQLDDLCSISDRTGQPAP